MQVSRSEICLSISSEFGTFMLVSAFALSDAHRAKIARDDFFIFSPISNAEVRSLLISENDFGEVIAFELPLLRSNCVFWQDENYLESYGIRDRKTLSFRQR